MTRLTDTQLLILNAAGDAKAGVALANIAAKVSVANPKRACESLVKRGLLTAAEIKLDNKIGKAAGYALTKIGEDALGIDDGPPPPEKPEAKAKTAAAETLNNAKLPKAGTGTRIIFETMTRPEGATRPEVVEAGGTDVSLSGWQLYWAEKYGLEWSREKQGRLLRYFLKAKNPAARAEA
jgi:hypothetical protein